MKPFSRPCVTPRPHFLTDIELYDGLFAGGVAAASHDTYLQNKVNEVSDFGVVGAHLASGTASLCGNKP